MIALAWYMANLVRELYICQGAISERKLHKPTVVNKPCWPCQIAASPIELPTGSPKVIPRRP